MAEENGFSLHSSIRDFSREEWDALAGGAVTTRHTFLDLLETHGCVGEGTGWVPMHASMHRDGVLYACMPLYLKAHSWGEYVFDWAWAEAYARYGLAYYPKAVCAVPFTPVPGSRIFAHDAAGRALLLESVLDWCRRQRLSSFHMLFAGEADVDAAISLGLMCRTGVQFHWYSRGERSFEEFLGRFNHDKRKKIRQDRRRAHADGLEFEVRVGAEIGLADWDFFERCYRHTYAEHRSSPYLNRAFFHALGQALPGHCVMILASQRGRAVASSLMLRDGDALYGRYWGTLEYHPCLHFECCYYQGIEYAIRTGLLRFEGGAQGEHKLARGLEPVPTYSLHWLTDPRFADAVADYLRHETGGIELYLDELRERLPFRHQGGDS